MDLGTGGIGSTGGSSGEPTRSSILPSAGLLGVSRPLVGGRHYIRMSDAAAQCAWMTDVLSTGQGPADFP